MYIVEVVEDIRLPYERYLEGERIVDSDGVNLREGMVRLTADNIEVL